MENITLAEFLEKKSESKRLQKRFAKAVKIYIHMTKDLGHAASDIAHAKEDCAFAIHNAEQVLDDCRGMLESWPTPESHLPQSDCEEGCQCEEELYSPLPADDYLEPDAETDVVEVASKHLRDATKDIIHALEDAGDVIRSLRKIDAILFDILEIAEAEDLVLDVSEAKQYIATKAKETQEQSF